MTSPPIIYASPEVQALAAELLTTYRGPQTPDVEARRRALAREMHELLPPHRAPSFPPNLDDLGRESMDLLDG